MDIVSFETAKKLKEAGFPQPEPAVGQFWHEPDNGGLFIIGKVYGLLVSGTYIEKDRTTRHAIFSESKFNGQEVFAPTATDILRQMPGVSLFMAAEKAWQAEWIGSSCFDDDPPISVGENPADVAAQAWLSINATTFDMKITGKLNDALNEQ